MGWFGQTSHHFQKGAFPCTVGSDNPEDVSCPAFDAYIVHERVTADGDSDSAGSDGGRIGVVGVAWRRGGRQPQDVGDTTH